MKNISEIKAEIAKLKGAAAKEAKLFYPVIKSRGVWLSTTDKDGQCDPSPGAEAQAWKGTVGELSETIELIKFKYPNVEALWLEGGYDGANSEEEFDTDNYTPWASNWELKIWSREDKG